MSDVAGDPSRQLLTFRHPKDASPPTLDGVVADRRAALESGRAVEAEARRPDPDVVLLSPIRARIVADFVEEMAARLRPGLAVGPIQSDGSISRFVKELADDMSRRAGLPTRP